MLKRFAALITATIFVSMTLLALPIASVQADSANLLANSSVENVSNNQPLNWTPNSWGTNMSSLLLTTDSHTGSYALSTVVNTRASGDAKWIPDSVPVTSGQVYTYADFYKSTADTEVDAAYYDASNNVSYSYLADAPTSATWQNVSTTFTVPATAARMVVMHILANVGSLTTDDFSLTNSSAPTPPPTNGNLIPNPSFETTNGSTPAGWLTGDWGTNTASFTYSTAGHTGTRSVRVDVTNYTNGDAKWYFSPVAITGGGHYIYSDYYMSNVATSLVAQFTDATGALSYIALGTLPAASFWTPSSMQFAAPNGATQVTIFHLLSGIGSLQIDDTSLTTNIASSAPSVSLTAPAEGSTLNGTTALTASASAPQGISSVQFYIDGNAISTPITSSPYQLSWNTLTTGNGTHSLSAIATASDGQTVSTGNVSVAISNTGTTNLIPNPSVETVDPNNSKLPLHWSKGGWGTNTTSYSYLTTGYAGTRSIKATISSYTTGAAYWSSPTIPIVGGQMYDYSDYFKSNVVNEVDLTFTMRDGSIVYQYIGGGSPSTHLWTQFRSQFTAPVGAISVNIYHDIFSVGWLTTDDFSLTPFSYQGFSRPIVSITDDDSYASFYNNALPLLQKYGLASTDYIITGYIDNTPGYMTSVMVKALYASGQEIGSHSITHPDLTTLGAAKIDNELKNSQTFLQNLLGVPILDYAAPYGTYNNQVVTDAMKYYQTYRGTQEGYNAKNNFNPYYLQAQNIVSTTTVADIQSWIAEAQATNTWLILVYHQVDADPAAGEYNTYPSDFDAQLAAIKASGIAVETVNQAMNEITPQL